ncbi:MAG: GNAT family N-acetyltransferase [Xanthobacteraceae bacterium]
MPLRSEALAEAPQIARVDVYDRLDDAEATWRQLEADNALMTPYQRFEWVVLWHHYVTRANGMTPLIIVARDRANTPLFILPLMLRKAGIATIAGFFGGRHANLNTGIWRSDIAGSITGEELGAILRSVAAKHGIDLYKLASQPDQLEGALRNPMALLAKQPAPDDVYVVTFAGNNGDEALKNCLTGTMRGRLRTKERKLQKLAGYRFFRAETEPDTDRVFDAFLKQKAEHFSGAGVANVFDDADVIAFLRSAYRRDLAQGRPVIELYALEGGGEIIAVFGGVNDGCRMSCMFNSYTNGEASRWSPGLILLTNLIACCADKGLTCLDLGAGYSFYKTLFCNDFEHVFDTIIGYTPKGHVTAQALRFVRNIKRRFKSNPAVWNRLITIRQMISP